MYIFDTYVPMYAIWFAAAVVFLILELATTALVSVWFVPGSIIAGIISMFSDKVYIQVVFFVIISAFCFPLSKLIYDKKIKNEFLSKGSVGYDLVVGKTGVVTVPVTKISGRIIVGDVTWEARTAEGTIPTDEIVQVTAVKGLVVFVTTIL